jgi:hypothetical protein
VTLCSQKRRRDRLHTVLLPPNPALVTLSLLLQLTTFVLLATRVPKHYETQQSSTPHSCLQFSPATTTFHTRARPYLTTHARATFRLRLVAQSTIRISSCSSKEASTLTIDTQLNRALLQLSNPAAKALPFHEDSRFCTCARMRPLPTRPISPMSQI